MTDKEEEKEESHCHTPTVPTQEIYGIVNGIKKQLIRCSTCLKYYNHFEMTLHTSVSDTEECEICLRYFNHLKNHNITGEKN